MKKTKKRKTRPFTVRVDNDLYEAATCNTTELRLRIAKIVNKHLKNKK